MAYFASSDIGGTFTDTAVMDPKGNLHRYKVSTVPDDPVKGILATLTLAAADNGIELRDFLSQISIFSHGTTIATNAALTRKGAKTGLIQTAGFGDTLFINRGYKATGLDEATSKNFRLLTKPVPFVERTLIREVNERIDYMGRVLAPLDEVQARQMVRELVERKVDSIAVCLLWAFKVPDHERRLREIIREEAPDVFVTISSDLLPRLGELARTQTAVMNAFLGPKVKSAMHSLVESLNAEGLPREPLLMRSNGGLAAARNADKEAVGILLSGPVGGVVGARLVGQQIGSKNVISTDMGGTSFDVGLIIDGRPMIQRETFIERQVVAVPSVAIDTIGAGGGSIASVQNGRLRVGPESAGAVPGPACYGAGGTEPTVTDADVVLGLVNPDHFLGGRIKLDAALARKAIEEKVAKPLGLSVEDAAEGIKRIVDSQMADLVRQTTVYRGYDPRDFILVAYGGAGPVHASSYGADLGVDKIVVPRTASILSAHGILLSDLVVARETSETMICPAGTDSFSDHIHAEDVNRVFAGLQESAHKSLSAQGVDIASVEFERYVDVRFRPQIFDLSIDVTKFPLQKADVDTLIEYFITTYEARFGTGSAFRAAGIEISAFRIVARAKLDRSSTSAAAAQGVAATDIAKRRIYSGGAWQEAAVYREHTIKPGFGFDGPAIVEFNDTTLVVGPRQRAEVDKYLNVTITTQA
ncbi:hydantoinase/oxoprolinase family protein [Mesorhizobium sp. ANAO-SY3R2]|uniref:hydantoinase/oxoprolinase family protein n=1 Tax=Mesorhizobium sp. ANAO-SY3R2 TaxID=3166644 RepID=UPI00366E1B10